MTAYYNEFDPYAAAWLRNLISAGLVSPGDVDERSIVDVRPDDLKGYTQVHFFAGIGGWSLAARIAGWADDRPLWTGSCPCQPFSAAGKRAGEADARHLWPEMRRLVSACRPPVVVGEQVASKDGRVWLAGVRTDLEDVAYDVWAVDTCAAGAGAPHIRQRLYWLADAQRGAAERRRHDVAGAPDSAEGQARERQRVRDELGASGDACGLADADGGHSRHRHLQSSGQHGQQPQDGGTGGLGDTNDARSQGRLECRDGADERAVGPSSVGGFWSRYDVVHCTDGKARRFEPGSFPLAHGVSNRVGRLRAYGNAIIPQVAAQVLGAYLDGPGV